MSGGRADVRRRARADPRRAARRRGGGRADRARLCADDELRRDAAADPRPAPGPAGGPGAGGAGLGAPVHGVPRRQRRAAVARGRRRADPPAGQLLGLLGVVGDARAGDQAGARGGGAGPRGARGRGGGAADDDRPGPADGHRRRRRADGHGAPGRSRPAPARAALVVRGRRRCGELARRSSWPRSRSPGATLRGRQRRRHAARLPRRLRQLRRAAARRPAARPARWPARSCGRSFFLPRAGRSMDDEQLQLEPVPLLREHGPGQGGAGA